MMTDEKFAAAVAAIVSALPADALEARLSLTLLCQDRVERATHDAKVAMRTEVAKAPWATDF